jgi:nitrite reductase (NO-forming)
MPENLRDKIRQWYILGIAICLIGGGAILASLDSQQANALKAASVAQTQVRVAASELPGRTTAPAGDFDSQTSRIAAASADVHKDASDPHGHVMVAQRPPARPPVGNAAPAPEAAAVAASASADAPGRQVFRKCQACHSMEPGKNILGPSLAGIVGRKAGSDPTYSYSPAMKQANMVWDAATLDKYLADPEKVVPGNKMPFPGLKTGQDRIDVIAYLASPGNGPGRVKIAWEACTGG